MIYCTYITRKRQGNACTRTNNGGGTTYCAGNRGSINCNRTSSSGRAAGGGFSNGYGKVGGGGEVCSIVNIGKCIRVSCSVDAAIAPRISECAGITCYCNINRAAGANLGGGYGGRKGRGSIAGNE